MIGCCCITPAGCGTLRWTTDDEARGRSASSTVGRLIICIITTVMVVERKVVDVEQETQCQSIWYIMGNTVR